MRTLGTDAILDSAGSVTIHIFGSHVAVVIGICVPAIQPIITLVARITLRTLRTRDSGVTVRTLRAAIARLAFRALATRSTRVALRTLKTVRTRRAHRTGSAGRAHGTRRAHRTLRTHRTVRTHLPRPAGGARTACRTLGNGRVELNLALLALLALDDLAL